MTTWDLKESRAPACINIFCKRDSLRPGEKALLSPVLSLAVGVSTSPHNENLVAFARGNLRGRREPSGTSHRTEPAGTFTVSPRIRGWIARPFVSQPCFLSPPIPLVLLRRALTKKLPVFRVNVFTVDSCPGRGWLTCTTAHCKSKPRAYRSSEQLTSFAASNVSSSRSKKLIVWMRKSAMK